MGRLELLRWMRKATDNNGVLFYLALEIYDRYVEAAPDDVDITNEVHRASVKLAYDMLYMWVPRAFAPPSVTMQRQIVQTLGGNLGPLGGEHVFDYVYAPTDVGRALDAAKWLMSPLHHYDYASIAAGTPRLRDPPLPVAVRLAEDVSLADVPPKPAHGGTFGRVYRRGDDTAIKQLTVRARWDVAWLEINAATQLQNAPHVVAARAFYVSKSSAYLSFPYINNGKTLAHVPFDNAVEHLPLIAGQLFEALDYMHHRARLAHLDIKPHNVLVDGHVMLADFGLTMTTCGGPTRRHFPTNVVSLWWRAPELMRCERMYSQEWIDLEAVDVWSLSIMLAEYVHPRVPDENIIEGRDETACLEYIVNELQALAPRPHTLAADLFFGRGLAFEPADRLSIREALEHPFVHRRGRKRLFT